MCTVFSESDVNAHRMNLAEKDVFTGCITKDEKNILSKQRTFIKECIVEIKRKCAGVFGNMGRK